VRKARARRFFVIAAPTVAIVAAVGAYLIYRSATAAGEYDAFAKCLTERGIKMYGAFWCPHCEDQRKDFGRSFRYVNYVECGVRGNLNAQTAACTISGIESYPTWEFADGSRVKGRVPLQILSGLSGCELKVGG
jgi:hypothetical protein